MIDVFIDYMPLFMFLALGFLLFTGYPVGAILGGVGLGFGFIGIAFGVFAEIEFFNIVSRIWGGIADNQVLIAIPMFIFMGTMFEKSGVARDLLHCLQVLLYRVPGGLALSVTVMGVIMAAMTGIIGASVVMMTIMALPVMLERNYNTALATGTIAASGTLGVLIPPSIMLVIMAELFGPIRRQSVCRSLLSGPVAGWTLYRLHHGSMQPATQAGSTFAPRAGPGEQPGTDWPSLAWFPPGDLPDLHGPRFDYLGLGNANRGLRSRGSGSHYTCGAESAADIRYATRCC